MARTRRRSKSEGSALGPLVLVGAAVFFLWSYDRAFLFVGLTFLALAGFVLLFIRGRRRKKFLAALAERDTLLQLTGHQFERAMAEVFRTLGYRVKETPVTGDQGVDLLLSKDGREIAVQLKRYVRPVGNKAVQEVVSGRLFYETADAWVVTTSSFTQSAHELAEKTGVRLIDGLELGQWLSELNAASPNPGRAA